jgi:hypothetical protein
LLVEPGQSRADAARQIAGRIITLPTHHYCDERMFSDMRTIFAAGY